MPQTLKKKYRPSLGSGVKNTPYFFGTRQFFGTSNFHPPLPLPLSSSPPSPFPPPPLPVATGDRLALDQIQTLLIHHDETRVRSASAEAALLDDQHSNCSSNRNSNGPFRPFSTVEPDFLDDSKIDANGNADDEFAHKMVNSNSSALGEDLPLRREKLGVLLETETDTPETVLDGQTEIGQTETGSPSETEQNPPHRNSRSSTKHKSLHAKSPSLKELEDESFEAQLTEEEKRIIFV